MEKDNPPIAAMATLTAKRYAKHEATTESARSILEGEATAREVKTARLRAARLAQEAEPKPPKAKAKGK